MEAQEYEVAAEELRQFVERIEAINVRIAEETDARKEVYDEAKSRGYHTKAIRKIVAMRKRRADELAAEALIEEMYRAALGMN